MRKYLLSLAVVPVLALALGYQLNVTVHSKKTKAQTSPTLLFSDDFNSFDTSKWTSCFVGNKCDHNENKELQCYNANNISIANGILYLTAKQQFEACSNSQNYIYTSGLIQTSGKFSFKYGYLETRAKTVKGQGFWPTIWTLPTDGTWPPELDPLEQVGGVTDTNFMSVHYGSNNTDPYVQQTYQGADFTASFHTYGMSWQPDRVLFYVDGTQVASYINRYNVPNKPMYLLANLAVGGSGGGTVSDNTVFPSSFQVDYIKVWSSKP